MSAIAPTRTRLRVSGMDCADCASTLERSLQATPGVTSASVRFETGVADVEHDPEIAPLGVLNQRIAALGYALARPTTDMANWTFDIAGMDCADCARSAEQAVARLRGVEAATVSFASARLDVSAQPGSIEPGQIARAVEQAGYRATLRAGTRSGPNSSRDLISRRSVEIAFALVIWAVAFAIDHLIDAGPWTAALYIASAVIAGYPVARAARVSLQVRRADMNVLMTIAAVGAVILGDFSEASSLMILFAIGLALQSSTIDRTRGAIRSLIDLAPSTARKRVADHEQTVPVAEVKRGDTILVLPGERVPVDGTVRVGTSVVDQSMITGESIPRDVTAGDYLFAGSLNGTSHLTILATTTGTDTTVTRIIEMVENAQASKAPSQALVERFAAVYTPIVVSIALILAVGFSIATGDVSTWTYRALVLLVVACPCALVISTPVAIVAAIGRASRRGVLFKGGLALEELATIRQIAFDKTGTVTHGRPDVVWARGGSGVSDIEILELAAALETGSTHPIGRGILRASAGLEIPTVTHVEAVPGGGVTANLGDDQVQIGSRLMFTEIPKSVEAHLRQADRESATVVLVGRNGIADGAIALSDSIRPISKRVVSDLDGIGIRSVMLSGDSAVVADAIGAAAGIADIRSGLMPDGKVAAIKELAADAPVAMVGDGINDAPALAQATVGIAMGVGGSGAAIEAADVALMGDDLTQIPFAIELARSTRTIVLQNIAFALASKLAFIALTATGYTSLWLAVVADMGASLIVTLNALRLMRDEPAFRPVATMSNPVPA